MDDLLTVKQVARLLKVHHLTVRRYINEGKLKAVKLAGNVRISQQDLHSFTEIYTPHSRPIKLNPPHTVSHTNPFSSGDALFRLKGRGLSIDNIK